MFKVNECGDIVVGFNGRFKGLQFVVAKAGDVYSLANNISRAMKVIALH